MSEQDKTPDPTVDVEDGIGLQQDPNAIEEQS